MLSLFNISLLLKGFPIKKTKKYYAKIKAIPVDEKNKTIEETRKDIVSYHLKNNLFYQNFVGNNDCSIWKNIPVMSKKDFQIPLKNRLSKGFTLKNVYINKTSGSSGNPFVFAKDKFCHALTWVDIQEKFGWYAIDFNTSLQARFYGISLDFLPNQKEKLKDFLSHRYRFSIFDLSDKKLEKILDTFRKKKFQYINGYTTAIVLFARYLERQKIILKNECPTLRYCVTTSEMLLDTDRVLLEKQLGIPVLNEYGASEVGLIAFENPKNNVWQLNTETLFVEIIDEKNNPVPNGVEGKIVITSLYNKAHPIIRYDIGDLGIIDENSTPELQILKKLAGRTNDFAQTPSGKKAAGMTFYSMTKKIMEEDGSIQEFIIRQKKIDTFHVEYVGKNELLQEKEAEIRAAFSQFLEPNLIVEFIKKENIEAKPSGKRQQFISEL